MMLKGICQRFYFFICQGCWDDILELDGKGKQIKFEYKHLSIVPWQQSPGGSWHRLPAAPAWTSSSHCPQTSLPAPANGGMCLNISTFCICYDRKQSGTATTYAGERHNYVWHWNSLMFAPWLSVNKVTL